MSNSRRHTPPLGAALIVLAVAACGPEDPAPPDPAGHDPGLGTAQRPNVVLILIDTLRADYLSFYGHTAETAPFLAKLARTSTVFRHTQSTSSWTAPATASVFTGLLPTQHGLVQGFHAQRKEQGDVLSLHPLPDEPTLVEHLHGAGYQTHGIATNINIGPELGFDRGFDQFQRLKHDESPAPVVLDLARQWVGDFSTEQPWFLYLHLMDVHEPWRQRDPWYQAPDSDQEIDQNRALYLSELAYLDQQLGEFLKDPPWDPQTTVVWFLSDHGEEFADHGKKGHGFTLYQELTGVLNLVHAPGLGVPAQEVTANVSLVDVLPTLLEWAGAETLTPPGARSLLPWLQGRVKAGDLDAWDQRVLFAHRQKRGRTEELGAAMLGHFKLIKDRDTGDYQLFDLKSDPGEKQDLYQEDHPMARHLRPKVDAALEDRATTGTTELILSEEALEELRRLGYIDDEH